MKPTFVKILTHALLFLGLTAVLLFAVFYGLSKYTRHDELIVVPDVTSLTVEQAAVFIEKKNLRFQVIDSIHTKTQMPGTIVEQKPAAGANVKEGRYLFLVINAYSEEKTSVPDVLDFSQRQAIALLEANGIVVSDVEYVPSEYRDLVLDVRHQGKRIPAGSRLDRGVRVTLVVGQGSSMSEIRSPVLQGLSLSEAIDVLHARNLNVGDVFYDQTPKNSSEAMKYRVYRQDPIGETPVVMGKKVQIWMSEEADLYEADPEVWSFAQDSIN